MLVLVVIMEVVCGGEVVHCLIVMMVETVVVRVLQ